MKIRKASQSFFFRPPVLGLTLALFNAFIVLIVTLTALVSSSVHTFTELYEVIYPGYGLSVVGLIAGLFWSWIYGFVFGYLVAWIYGWLVSRHLHAASQQVFQIDPSHKINVLQEGSGARPFTVVFVANPVIAHPWDNRFEADPILNNSVLFYRTVLRVLRSFANNELLRLPQIARRMRMITLFDTTRTALEDANALCESISDIDHILAPRLNSALISEFVKSTNDNGRRIDYADVIFVISASEKLTRSAARFTVDGTNGRPFKFTFSEAGDGPLTEKQHAFEAAVPGVVALSAWDDRLKTPLHEFAHALSSLENGAIIDEYLDQYDDSTESLLQFVINRKRRLHPTDPVPDVYATYQGPDSEAVLYYSDRYRSDKPTDWTSYVAERPKMSSSCIMDIAYFDYHYDKLIFDFLYDKLLVKINRPGS